METGRECVKRMGLARMDAYLRGRICLLSGGLGEGLMKET